MEPALHRDTDSKAVGIWIRVSTEDHAKGESPEHHERRARYYADSKEWKVLEVYHLEGVSGKLSAVGLARHSTARSSHPYQAISVKAPVMMKPVNTKNGRSANEYRGAAAAEIIQVATTPARRIPNVTAPKAARLR